MQYSQSININTQLRQYLKLDTVGDCVQLLCNVLSAGMNSIIIPITAHI